MSGDEWMEQAACRGKPIAVFFPSSGEDLGEARRVCAVCPVARQCLDYAVEHNEGFGVWGGESERSRRRIRRRRGITGRPRTLDDILFPHRPDQPLDTLPDGTPRDILEALDDEPATDTELAERLRHRRRDTIVAARAKLARLGRITATGDHRRSPFGVEQPVWRLAARLEAAA